MVIDKPVGLFTQAAPGVDSLQVRLTEQIKLRDQHPGTPFVGLPHRLDRGTSGVILVAKNQRALSRFGDQFQSRKIGKFYLAAAVGAMPAEDARTILGTGEAFEWSDYIRKVTDQPLAEVCTAADEGAKLAQLTVRSIASAGGVTLLLIRLHTGRMHQIRIQAASRGLKILGDTAYGGPVFFDVHEDTEMETAMALHALRLEIRHPQSAKQMAFTAEPPRFWDNLPREIYEAVQSCVARSRSQSSTGWDSL